MNANKTELSADSGATTVPLVTVGIVFFNAMPYFPLAVQSVVKQTHSGLELLLIDDGSTDGSLEFARSLVDPRVRVYSDGRNLSLNPRLNQAVAMARGKYFFRMDADDVMMPERIEKQIKVLQAHDDNTVTGTGAIYIDGAGQVTGFRSPHRNPQTAYQARHAFIHSSVAAPTAWFKRNKYSEEVVFYRSQDAELWVRSFRHSRFVILPELLMFYRDPGTIKVENYVGTAIGLVVIAIRQSSHSRVIALIWATTELCKCWIAITLNACRMTGVLVRRRQSGLSAEMRSKYQQILNDIAAGAKESCQL